MLTQTLITILEIVALVAMFGLPLMYINRRVA